MQITKKIEEKIIDLKKYTDVKNDKLSEVIRFFQEEMRELENLGFPKSQQIKIFSVAFGRDIKRSTYIALFEKYITNKTEEKKEVSATSDVTTPVADREVKKPTLNMPKRKEKKNLDDDVDMSEFID